MKIMEANKQKILNTALNLFSEKGYDAVGVQAICEQSQISKPTLYYYFGNKAGVLKEVFKENYETLNSQLSKNSVYLPNIKFYNKDVFPVLVKVTESYFKFAEKNPKFYRMILSALCAPKESELSLTVKDFNKEQYKIIENMFLEMSKAHQNMKRHEKRLSRTFIGMINTYILLNSEDTTTEELVHQFMHGIFS